MSKNKKFKRTYVIEVEGVTTNRSAETFIDTCLTTTVKALDAQFKQVSVKTTEGAIEDEAEIRVDPSLESVV